jgi:hypothetical protein
VVTVAPVPSFARTWMLNGQVCMALEGAETAKVTVWAVVKIAEAALMAGLMHEAVT